MGRVAADAIGAPIKVENCLKICEKSTRKILLPLFVVVLVIVVVVAAFDILQCK